MMNTQKLLNLAMKAVLVPPRVTSCRLRKGLTLIEVMIGLVVMGMLGVTLTGTLMVAERNSRQAQIRGTALGVAKRQIEILTATSFGNIVRETNKSFTIPPNVMDQFSAGTSGTRLEGTYTTELLKNNLFKVTVRVKWRNATKNTNSQGSEVVLTQLVASNNEVALRDTDGDSFLFYTPPPPPPPAPPPPPPPPPPPTPGTAPPPPPTAPPPPPPAPPAPPPTSPPTGGSSWSFYGGKWQFPK